jgi:hypothetical protein
MPSSATATATGHVVPVQVELTIPHCLCGNGFQPFDVGAAPGPGQGGPVGDESDEPAAMSAPRAWWNLAPVPQPTSSTVSTSSTSSS